MSWQGDADIPRQEEDISDGAASSRLEWPADPADVEQQLYEAIRRVGASGGTAGDAFIQATHRLALRVARVLLKHYAGLLDPAMLDRGASAEDAARVIQSVWYEALFGARSCWRRIRGLDAGGRLAAYLWEIAKRQLLVKKEERAVRLAESVWGEGAEGVVVPPAISSGRADRQAWEYVRRTDALSECVDRIAEEVLTTDGYLVWHERVWGAGDSRTRLPFREVGARVGRSEEAARKAFERAEKRIKRFIDTHPDDERVRRLQEVVWVDGKRCIVEDDVSASD